MNWIKVEDELPDRNLYDWVLVIAKMVPEGWHGVPAVAELRGDNIWYFRDEDLPAEETLGIKVTHWMTLPESPKN
jgi:hypothetical protein